MPTEVYGRLRPRIGHRLAWRCERTLALLQRRPLCAWCGETARFCVGGKGYCYACAWQANDGNPPGDPYEEPPGAGADPYGRPSPATHPEYWCE